MSILSDFTLGFIAGEGSFSIDVQPLERRTYNVAVYPRFQLLVHEKEIVYKLCDDTGIGEVRERRNGVHTWNVRTQEDCVKLIDFIEENSNEYFEATRKFEQYSRWKEAVQLLDGDDSPEDLKQAVTIGYEIGMPEKRKRSVEDFHRLIDKGGHSSCGYEKDNGELCQRRVKSADQTCYQHPD